MDIDRIEMIAGHPALDFVNTAEGRGTDGVVNYLSDYGRLVRWCHCAGLAPDAVCQRLVRQSAEHSIVASRIWQRAIDLREDLNTVFRAGVLGGPPPERELGRLNEVLTEAYRQRRLLADESGCVHWGWDQEDGALELPMWEIAQTAAGLLTDNDMRSRMKICANGPCDWLFLDTSRNGRRRWCRMNVCGNESKVRRFRERQRRVQGCLGSHGVE